MIKFIFTSILMSLSISNIFSLETDIVGSWLQYLEPRPWENGQFRRRILSFQKKDNLIIYNKLLIYPEPNIRSSLEIGTVEIQDQSMIFHRKNIQVIVYKGSGIPTPFSIKKNNTAMDTSISWSHNNENLFIGRDAFQNYVSLWEEALTEKDPMKASDLFMLNIYAMHNQIDKFGTVKMLSYRNSRIPGLLGGYVELDSKLKGLFGLGNSGLYFSMQGLEQFIGTTLNGRWYGGNLWMNGEITLKLKGKNIFKVKFDNVKIYNGYARSGYYEVYFLGGITRIPVSRYGK